MHGKYEFTIQKLFLLAFDKNIAEFYHSHIYILTCNRHCLYDIESKKGGGVGSV